MQLFVRVPGQPTVAVELAPGAGVAELRAALEARTGIPAAEQLLTRGGRAVDGTAAAPPASLAPGATLDLLLRLAGGKGGFGALLRGQGRDGKITDNFDACRDLQGRRVRQVEAEKKLREWAAQSKERELEKVAERHIRDLARQQRKERDYEINVEAVKNEQREALERVHDAVQSALAEGLAAQAAGSSGSGGSSSDTEERAEAGGSGSPAAGAKRKAPEAAAGASGSGSEGKAAAAAAKRPKKGGMLDVLEGSDDDDSDSGSGSDDE